MKTKKCRPVLVECSRKSRKGDLVISPIGLGIHISDIEYSFHNKQQLILISLEDEKIEVGDLVYDTLKNRLFNARSNYDGMEYIHKVIATQDKISPEYIAKFIEQYNNGKVDDVEIEMQEWNKAKMPKDFLKYIEPGCGLPIIAGSEEVYYKPKLTNKFVTIVTIVEKKEPILYTEEEVLQLLYKWSVYKVNIELEKLADELPNILSYDEWFEQNKKHN